MRRLLDMDWGLRNRLSGIINQQNGKGVMLAVDHGYFLGPTERLENPGKTMFLGVLAF
jgi:putative autoinducer-2 (AI-2) aldolase